jgi:predicted RNase H-like nuclease
MKKDVLMGWDAAWTPNGSGAWAVAVDGRVVLHECTPNGPELLHRLEELLRQYTPGVIALDFPLAVGGVRGWREADLATTRAFSRYGCPVHSPTPERPGAWGDQIVEVMKGRGYHLGITSDDVHQVYAEVYPHTVLLEIFRRTRRLPYKAARSAQYWPGLSREARVNRLLETYRMIWNRLDADWTLPTFPDPQPPCTLRTVKTLEDLTDALLCLEAARRIRSGDYLPFGNDQAAIWNPNPRNLPPSGA